MTDPTRYIRKAIIAALEKPDFSVYGQIPPTSATTPYATVSVALQARSVKGCAIYEATISIDIYNEFREYGGRKTMDELTDDILATLAPTNSTYLPIDGFVHANCRLLSTNERKEQENSTAVYVKSLRFLSLITE